MGQSKQMLDIGGEALLLKTVKAAINSQAGFIVVVLGANEKMHREILTDLPVDILYNKNWESGMGGSLKAGLLHLRNIHPLLEAVIILVCDQPLLKGEHIFNLLSGYEQIKKPIIASMYSGTPGVPVLFDKVYFPKLMALPDDQGAKKTVLENPDDVFGIEFPGGEFDLDTMEDYNAFKKSTQ